MTLGIARNTIKMREAFPFFFPTVFGFTKSHTGIHICAGQCFEQSIERAPLGAGFVGQRPIPSKIAIFLSSHLECEKNEQHYGSKASELDL